MSKDNKRMKAFSKRLGEMRKSAPTAVAKAEEDTAPKLSSVDTPKQKINVDLGNLSFKEAFRAARKNNPGEPFTWRGKSYSTALASENKAPAKRQGTSGAGKADTNSESAARQKYADIMAKNFAARANAPKPAPGSTAPRNTGAAPAAPAPARNIDRFNLSRVREEANKPAPRSRLFAGEDKLKAAQERAAAAQRGYAKGGKVKKFGKGGMPKEQVTGGSGTVPMTPERQKFLDQMRKQNEEAQKQGKREGRAAPGHKAGGKIMKKSDKAGRALVKKSADTMGRAMKMACGGKMKGYAKGGSIDGIAKKGKTRCKGAK